MLMYLQRSQTYHHQATTSHRGIMKEIKVIAKKHGFSKGDLLEAMLKSHINEKISGEKVTAVFITPSTHSMLSKQSVGKK